MQRTLRVEGLEKAEERQKQAAYVCIKDGVIPYVTRASNCKA